MQTILGMLSRTLIKHQLAPDEHDPRFPRSSRPGTAWSIEVEDLGYPGFYTSIMFDGQGELLAIGAWE